MKLCLKAQTLINKTEVIMTFLDSFKTCLKKTLTISGRASRSEFWWFQLADILGVFVLSMLIGIASQINETLGLLLASLQVLPFSLQVLPCLQQLSEDFTISTNLAGLFYYSGY